MSIWDEILFTSTAVEVTTLAQAAEEKLAKHMKRVHDELVARWWKRLMPIEHYGSGDPYASIWIVGEAWGRDEAAAQKPFVGSSGSELTRMLSEAGIDRNLCFLINCINEHPKDNEAWTLFHPSKGAPVPPLAGLYPKKHVRDGLNDLYAAIDHYRPKLIIAVGNYALWALTGLNGTVVAKDKANKSTGVKAPSGIHDWRGSQVWFRPLFPIEVRHTTPLGPRLPIPVLPIIHPAAILRQWELRARTVHDLRARASKYNGLFTTTVIPPLPPLTDWEEPRYDFLAPPTFSQAMNFLQAILNRAANTTLGPLRLAVDVETAAPLLVCIGFAPSTRMAMSLPLVKIANPGTKANVQYDSYWTVLEEASLWLLVRKILTHPNIYIVGQNFAYDTQYLEEHFGVIPNLKLDTMLMHHLVFPGTPKGLDYLSSLYCEHHKFWKNDSKDWAVNDDLERNLRYNCIDAVKTLEIANELETVIASMSLQAQWDETLTRYEIATEMTRNGVLIDQNEKTRQRISVISQRQALEFWLLKAFPQEVASDPDAKTLWFNSPQQSARFLYGADYLGLSPVYDRKTGSLSTGKEAIEELRTKHPRLKPLFDVLQAMRSLAVYYSHFYAPPQDPDGRMRCTYNPAGTETFRFNSSENSFGRGTNLQNIPSGNEDE